jgi:hypothetical protein
LREFSPRALRLPAFSALNRSSNAEDAEDRREGHQTKTLPIDDYTPDLGIRQGRRSCWRLEMLLLLVCLLVLAPCVAAQQLGPIQNTEGRKTVSLDGEWQAIIDPYESGFYDYRYQPNPNGYFKNAKPKTKSELIEYDFDKSGTLKVPGDWNTQSEQLFFYEGTVWYKKSFDYQRKADRRLFVHFGAASTDFSGKQSGY